MRRGYDLPHEQDETGCLGATARAWRDLVSTSTNGGASHLSDCVAELPTARVRVAVVGISETQVCGVRDHARLLLEAMDSDGCGERMHWLSRCEPSLRAGCKEIRSWARQLAPAIKADPADAVVLHYSVFAFSYRGIPIFVRPLLSALRRTGLPVVTVLHEFAYPWRRRGWRGTVWALTQRMTLMLVVRSSAALVVTTESRARWLASKWWLPRRLTMVAPVFGNLPPVVRPHADPRRPVIGMFGYSYENVAVSSVLDAIGLIRQGGIQVTLRLLGAPGRSSATAEAWLAAAAARGLEHAVDLSGVLPAQDLSNALASCTVLLFANRVGPESRNGTLAASLASGVPLVAIDGPACWPKLRHSEAARVVSPTSQALAESIHDLLTDEQLRDDLGTRGRVFAEREMSISHSAKVVTDLVNNAVSRWL